MANWGAQREIIAAAVEDADTFLQLILSQNADRSAAKSGDAMPWTKVTARPVAIRGERQVQFSYWDGRQVVHRNFPSDEARGELARLLDGPFRQAHVQTTAGDIQARISKRGKVFLSRSEASRQVEAPSLAHDRAKDKPLQARRSRSFLEAVGITDAQGRVRPGMGSKHRQVNEFLRFIERAVADHPADKPLHVVDAGCGRAYLTFAAYHYLNEVRGLTAFVQGVDANPDVLEAMRPLRDELGWERLTLHAATIAAFEPEAPPDLVLSLHACDTATDEALAQAVRWGSRWILAAPCCQHEFYDQLGADEGPSAAFRPVLRHGILRHRLADLLTDAFRAQILRTLGYSTQVVEFVSPEHTSKNLMIVAERGLPPGDEQMAREYRSLKAFWGVTPVLETMLAGEMGAVLGT